MLCKNCGEYNDEGSVYCQYCGSELESADFENYDSGAPQPNYGTQSGYAPQPDYTSQPNYASQPNYNARPDYGAVQPTAQPAAPQSAPAAAGGNVGTRQPYANSHFDGNGFQLIGWNILTFLIGFITLGFGIPWACCLKIRWETQHTVVNGKRLYFNGTALQLFGKMILWGLILDAICALPFLIPWFMSMCHASGSAIRVAFVVCIVFAALVVLFGGTFYTVYIKKWIVKHTTYVADTGNYYSAASYTP